MFSHSAFHISTKSAKFNKLNSMIYQHFNDKYNTITSLCNSYLEVVSRLCQVCRVNWLFGVWWFESSNFSIFFRFLVLISKYVIISTYSIFSHSGVGTGLKKQYYY